MKRVIELNLPPEEVVYIDVPICSIVACLCNNDSPYWLVKNNNSKFVWINPFGVMYNSSFEETHYWGDALKQALDWEADVFVFESQEERFNWSIENSN